ncbi:cysteine/serine-rich nuclear protein [Paragonimus westermani]|uniref:Cysteine/serine-rich nuclear protein n=1 Tax=Paragonimus westermani TaxID=34504 RepID=A0A5J4NV92_9TREM|nr:cysteine/serine-rich nuclear protein [Paragonimus westermani]
MPARITKRELRLPARVNGGVEIKSGYQVVVKQQRLRTIDHLERVECQAIRLSREICGCSCSGGVCLPDECYCARNGIRCQVDRALFPCSCIESAQCQNPEGRIEFDPIRVRTHYLHTRLRLDVARAQQPVNATTLGSDEPTQDQVLKYHQFSVEHHHPRVLDLVAELVALWNYLEGSNMSTESVSTLEVIYN